MITNNEDFATYLTNKGVPCTYLINAPKVPIDDLAVLFTNDCHALSVCGNRFQDNKKEDFEHEADHLLNWLERCNKVIMISNVIKLGTPYMAENFEMLQQRYDKLNIEKQVFNTREIGSLLVPHRVQIRYKNVQPIMFDFEGPKYSLRDPKYVWLDDNGNYKRQQVHYINVINTSNDTETRRKLRYLPEYAIFSQLYKKLYL